MCLPCWPFTDVYLEEEKKKKEVRHIMVFDPNTRRWVQIGEVSNHLVTAAGLVIGICVIFQYKPEIHFVASIPTSNYFLCDFANKNFTTRTLIHSMNATPRELISISQLLRDIGIHYINFTTNKVISILQSIQTTMTEIPVQNFQPQVPDTTAGPHEHTYIPRADGAIIVNGVVYVRETKTPIPVVPTPAMPSAAQQQHVYPQPAFQPYPYNPYLQFAGNNQQVPFGAGYVPQPAMNTYGATGSEIQLQQMQIPEASKKQDMKPSDDDPFRMYWVRELDDTWTQRNRLTIDSGDIGEIRWYVTDGVFYAARLPA
ncbi:hypothetical protein QC760_007275 [Botrytis cinerea]